MTVFVSSGSTSLPSKVGLLRVVMSGEGATYNIAGAATTFLGITAFGGNRSQAGTGGAGGTSFVPPSFSSAVTINQNGNAGTDGSGVVQNNVYPFPWTSYSTGTGGIGVTYTSPSLQQDYYRGAGGNGSSTPPAPNGQNTNQNAGQLGAGQNSCPSGQVYCGTSGGYTQCCYSGQQKTFYGGGGAGAFIDISLRPSQITQYLGTTQNFFVNQTEAASDPNALNTGSLEIYYAFPECYVKTSSGWQRIKNVHVRSGSPGWQECVNLILLPDIPVPMLSVVPWSGTIEDIPTGWALCDGSTVTLSDGTEYTLPNLNDTILKGSPNASSRNTFVGTNHGWSATTTTSGAHNPNLPFYYGIGTGSNIGNTNNDSAGDHFHTLTAEYSKWGGNDGDSDSIGVSRIIFIASISASSALPNGSFVYYGGTSSSPSGLSNITSSRRFKFFKGRIDNDRTNISSSNWYRFIHPDTIVVSESGNHTHKSQYDDKNIGSVCENYGGCSNETSVGMHSEHWTTPPSTISKYRYAYRDSAYSFRPYFQDVKTFQVTDNTSIDPSDIIIATLADYYQDTSVWKKCDGTNGTINLATGVHPRTITPGYSLTSGGSNDSFTIDVEDSNTWNGNSAYGGWDNLNSGLGSYDWNHTHKQTNTVGPVNSNAATEWHTSYNATHDHNIDTITIERQVKAYNIDFIQYKI